MIDLDQPLTEEFIRAVLAGRGIHPGPEFYLRVHEGLYYHVGAKSEEEV